MAGPIKIAFEARVGEDDFLVIPAALGKRVELLFGDVKVFLEPGIARVMAHSMIVAADHIDPPGAATSISEPYAQVTAHHGAVYPDAELMICDHGENFKVSIPDRGNDGTIFLISRLNSALKPVGYRLREPINRDEWVDDTPYTMLVPIERIPEDE
jgi:hypothetical protein